MPPPSTQPNSSGRSMPAYMRLAQSLLEDIRAGVYPVGSRLPTENELCRSLKVSRHTVRDALRILVELGMVQRRPRAGTTVIAQHSGRRYQPSVSSLSELVLFAQLLVQKTLGIDDVVVDPDLGTALGIAPGSHWRRGIFLLSFPEDEIPLFYSEVYVPERYRTVLDELAEMNWEPASIPVRERIEGLTGIRAAEAHQRISATALPDPAARLLKAEAGSAGLELLLTYSAADGEILEISNNLFRADRYSYSTRVRLPG